MPFQRYLDPPPVSNPGPVPPISYDARTAALGVDASTFSSNVHFQMPSFFGAPIVPPGGGAEVLPPGFLAPPNHFATSWFSPAIFNPNSDDFASTSAVPKYELYAQDSLAEGAFQLTAHRQSYSRTQAHTPQLHPSPHPAPLHVSFPSPYIPPEAQLPASSLPLAPIQPPAPVSAAPSPLLPTSMPMCVPSSVGLPVYSTSGFDLLSVLARVANRPNPKIGLGPVDMTCSFVVIDTRRYDAPIVYASPTFCKLTGYDEEEVLGRNCRFLQSPDGRLQRGELRRYTAPEAVSYLKRCTSQDKECQTSLINYRKGGTPFINLVTVIPIAGGVSNGPDEADDIVYHVGFQVDLTEQPNAILQKLRDGTYLVDYSRKLSFPAAPSANPSFARNWRASSTSMSGVSGALHTLLADPAFLASIPLSFETVLPLASATGEKADSYEGNKPLHLILLESGPDFVHVVSLKGAFLYVAPAVRRVLGYAPEDLVGHSIAEFCHPADVVPLMRELKESSVAGAPLMQENGPRKVDLLFRMSTKAGRMVWVECRGRLHIEPGKGRKAIILSGRVRSMPTLTWGPVERAGGLSAPVPGPSTVAQGENAMPDTHVEVEREFWGMLSANGTFLFAGAAVRDVLGWGVGEVIGRTVSDFIGGAAPADAQRAIEDEVARVCSAASNTETRSVSCEMKRKDGAHVPVQIVLYRSLEETDASAWLNVPSSSSPSSSSSAPAPYPVVCQIKAFDPVSLTLPRTSRIVHPLQESIYDEMHISRGSSWQYELQQLKYANQRMVEEVASLETAIQTARARQPSLPPAQAHHIPVAQQRRALSYTQEIQSLQYIHPPRVGLLGHNGEEWRPQLAPYQEPRATVPNMNRLPVKRAWDDPERGDPS